MSKMLKTERMCERTVAAMDLLGLSEEELTLAVADANYLKIAGWAIEHGIGWHEAQYQLVGMEEPNGPSKPVSLVNYREFDHGAFCRDRNLLLKMGSKLKPRPEVGVLE